MELSLLRARKDRMSDGYNSFDNNYISNNRSLSSHINPFSRQQQEQQHSSHYPRHGYQHQEQGVQKEFDTDDIDWSSIPLPDDHQPSNSSSVTMHPVVTSNINEYDSHEFSNRLNHDNWNTDNGNTSINRNEISRQNESAMSGQRMCSLPNAIANSSRRNEIVNTLQYPIHQNQTSDRVNASDAINVSNDDHVMGGISTSNPMPQNSSLPSSGSTMESSLKNEIERLQALLAKKDDALFDLESSLATVEAEASHRINQAESRAEGKIRLAEEQLRRVQKEADAANLALVKVKKRRFDESLDGRTNRDSMGGAGGGGGGDGISYGTPGGNSAETRGFGQGMVVGIDDKRGKIQDEPKEQTGNSSSSGEEQVIVKSSMDEALCTTDMIEHTKNDGTKKHAFNYTVSPILLSERIASHLLLHYNGLEVSNHAYGYEHFKGNQYSHSWNHHRDQQRNEESFDNFYTDNGMRSRTEMTKDEKKQIITENRQVRRYPLTTMSRNHVELSARDRDEIESDGALVKNLLLCMCTRRIKDGIDLMLPFDEKVKTGGNFSTWDLARELMIMLVSKFPFDNATSTATATANDTANDTAEESKNDPLPTTTDLDSDEKDKGQTVGKSQTKKVMQQNSGIDNGDLPDRKLNDHVYTSSKHISWHAANQILSMLLEVFTLSAEARSCYRQYLCDNYNSNNSLQMASKKAGLTCPSVVKSRIRINCDGDKASEIDKRLTLTASNLKESLWMDSVTTNPVHAKDDFGRSSRDRTLLCRDFSDILSKLIIDSYSTLQHSFLTKQIGISMQVDAMHLLQVLMCDAPPDYRENLYKLDVPVNSFWCIWLDLLLKKQGRERKNVVSILEMDTFPQVDHLCCRRFLYTDFVPKIKASNEQNNNKDAIAKSNRTSAYQFPLNKEKYVTDQIDQHNELTDLDTRTTEGDFQLLSTKVMILKLLEMIIHSSDYSRNQMFESEKDQNGKDIHPVTWARKIMAAILDDLQGFAIPFISSTRVVCGDEGHDEPLLELVLSQIMYAANFLTILCESATGFDLVRIQMKTGFQSDKQKGDAPSGIAVMADMLECTVHALFRNGEPSLDLKQGLSSHWSSIIKGTIMFFQLIIAHVQKRRRLLDEGKMPKKELVSFLSIISDAERKNTFCSSCHSILQLKSNNRHSIFIDDSTRHAVKVILDEIADDEEEEEENQRL